MKIPRPSGGSRQSAGVGKIYIKFDTPESAKKALQSLAGRKFADRTVVTTHFSEVPFPVHVAVSTFADSAVGKLRCQCMVTAGLTGIARLGTNGNRCVRLPLVQGEHKANVAGAESGAPCPGRRRNSGVCEPAGILTGLLPTVGSRPLPRRGNVESFERVTFRWELGECYRAAFFSWMPAQKGRRTDHN